ncbi:hypothetical protein PsorP6_006635 [Peronosclerospora sorghi]|uniref:Uncharacterized protein n=1 Tax=Peronosclerospora sorghi TaxID=230839 RepID=A0ACC0W7B2_9STRA|nr:hypothetical protein PsorP6_006635 [Peronosclerospora sorghi]
MEFVDMAVCAASVRFRLDIFTTRRDSLGEKQGHLETPKLIGPIPSYSKNKSPNFPLFLCRILYKIHFVNRGC